MHNYGWRFRVAMADTQKRVDLTEYEAFVSFLRKEFETGGPGWSIKLRPMWLIKLRLRREDITALEALQAHLSKDPGTVAKLLDQEKRLRKVIRVSAENGHLDAVEKAVPALKQLLAIHPFLPGHILQMNHQWRKCVLKAAETNFENMELVEETWKLYNAMTKKHKDWTIYMSDDEPLLDYCDDCVSHVTA